MKLKYILVFILPCLSFAHDAELTVTDPVKQTTTTSEPNTEPPSPNNESGPKKGFKVSNAVSKFMATIRERPSDLYLCSATFIRKDALLTTARCLFGRNTEKLFVHSNSSNLELEGPGNTAIKNIYLHPNFDMNPVQMDFAIITLKKPVDYITPVSLPYKKMGRPGAVGTMHTWRFTPNTNKFLIHEHQSKILSNSKCFLIEREVIPDGVVCAKGLQYKEGNYDNGMPFIINKKGKNYLFGLNHVTGKLVTEKVDKIWKIHEIMPWITNVLKKNIEIKKPTNPKADIDYTNNDEDEDEDEEEEEEEEEEEDDDENGQNYVA